MEEVEGLVPILDRYCVILQFALSKRGEDELSLSGVFLY
jgi:hypothetical protein